MWLVFLTPIIGYAIYFLFPVEYYGFLMYFDLAFLRLINLIVPFIVFSMMVKSVVDIISDDRNSSTIFYISLYYFMSTLIGVLISFSLCYIFELGRGIDLSQELNNYNLINTDMQKADDLSNIFLNLIPQNIILILYNTDLLQLFVFSILFGIVTAYSSLKKNIMHFVEGLYTFALEVIEYIMHIVPLAVMSFVLKLLSENNSNLYVFIELLAVIFIAYLIRYIILLLEIYYIANISPVPFIMNSIGYQYTAFMTCSSKATLPIAIKDMKRMGYSQTSQQYSISIGSMLNTSFGVDMVAMVMFVVGMFEVNLTLLKCISIITLSIFGAVVGTGIPAAGVIVLSMILNILGLPLNIISIFVVIDRVIDVASTAMTVTHVVGSTLVIDSYQGKLDKEKYNSSGF